MSVPSSSETTLTCRSLISSVVMSWLLLDSVIASSSFDGVGEALAHRGHGDLGDDLAEEAAHHQAAGLVLGDAAGPQVEQLLVVETSGGAGVSGADDLAGLDLQVRHRVGAGAVGEHQVAVRLEGVGAGGLGADQHVADPHGVRVGLARSPDRLAAHPCTARASLQFGCAWSTSSRDSKCWPSSAKYRPSSSASPPGAAEPHRRRQPHDVAAEGDRDVPQHRVLAQRRVMRADVHRVVGPVGDRRPPSAGPRRRRRIRRCRRRFRCRAGR